MDPVILILLSSGLFLGWSLGANDAANVFGTAVGSRMVRFRTAAIICGVFVVVGAVAGGAGTTHGLGKLGAVNALPGAFTVALAAAATVYWMTKLGLPVSVTQAIVGGIIGWNIFSGSLTDMSALARIVGTWVACPILGALFAFVLYKVVAFFIWLLKPHLIRLDFYTRVGLVLAGAFGAYCLGANNIANVMGVFVSSSPLGDTSVAGLFAVTSAHKLFLLGGLAIAVGVFYSKRVMMTVGEKIMPVSPVGAWVVVVAQSLVLFVFSSRWLQGLVLQAGMPAIPLVPVSSSQAVVGAVIGVGLCHGFRGVRQIKWSVLAKIGSGWVSTPVISGLLCFVLLFVLQNVFELKVREPVRYELSPPVIERLEEAGVPVAKLASLAGEGIEGGVRFRDDVRRAAGLSGKQLDLVVRSAEVHPIRLDRAKLENIDPLYLSAPQVEALWALAGRSFDHKWQLREALARAPAWRLLDPARPANKAHNTALHRQLDYVCRTFHVGADEKK